MHNFEFDPKKNAANRKKHGIDFVSAQALWNDPDLLEIDARSHDEPRTIDRKNRRNVLVSGDDTQAGKSSHHLGPQVEKSRGALV